VSAGTFENACTTAAGSRILAGNPASASRKGVYTVRQHSLGALSPLVIAGVL